MDFAGIAKGFSAGGNKIEGALALADALFEAGKAVFDIVKAASVAEADAALARLDAQLERVAPLAGGLRAIVMADIEAGRAELHERFRTSAPPAALSSVPTGSNTGERGTRDEEETKP